MSPIGYILMAVFWAVSGYFFSFNVFFVHAVHMVTAFHNMSLLLMLILPLVTMRIFAEEAKMGTMELMLTMPLSELGVVCGKFLAAAIVFLAMLAGSAAAVVPLVMFGEPDLGPIVGGYLGVFLLGLCFLGIGIFISSLCSNQIVAAVVTWAVLIVLWFADYAATLFNDTFLVTLFRQLSFSVHYLDLIRGVIGNNIAAYAVGLIGVTLVASAQALKARRLV